jgi:hypothetical protein
MSNPHVFARLARDAGLIAEAQRAFLSRSGFTSGDDVPEAQRDALNRRWLVSSEKARLDVALARVDDLPCASDGLNSYRYRGVLGPVMIGAADAPAALDEAKRSIFEKPDPALLDVWDWNVGRYVPAFAGAEARK